jgi:hypothetical protein
MQADLSGALSGLYLVSMINLCVVRIFISWIDFFAVVLQMLEVGTATGWQRRL